MKVPERHHLERNSLAFSLFAEKLEKGVVKTARCQYGPFFFCSSDREKSFNPVDHIEKAIIRKATDKLIVKYPERVLVRVFGMPHELALGIVEGLLVNITSNLHSQIVRFIINFEHGLYQISNFELQKIML